MSGLLRGFGAARNGRDFRFAGSQVRPPPTLSLVLSLVLSTDASNRSIQSLEHPQPVSAARANLDLLRRQRYRVTWKVRLVKQNPKPQTEIPGPEKKRFPTDYQSPHTYTYIIIIITIIVVIVIFISSSSFSFHRHFLSYTHTHTHTYIIIIFISSSFQHHFLSYTYT